MQYLIEGQTIATTLDDCNCWVNVMGKCKLCNGHGCASNSNPCPTHCWSQACNPRQDPMLRK